VRSHTNLEDGGYNRPHILEELLLEHGGQIDVHHDVAVTHVGRNVHTFGGADDDGHELVEVSNAHTAHHLGQTWSKRLQLA